MEKPKIIIRALEPDDMPRINEVISQPRAIWGTLQVPLQSLEVRRKWQQSASDADTQLVALIGGQVVGVAGMQLETNRRRAHAASVGMVVHDDHAGRGAGRALLVALIEKAENWLNIRRIELSVWTDNVRAIALYESLGFEREGVLRRYAFRQGVFVDALTMARLRP